MNSSLVSIIVPVYKTEKYIHRCVHSLINQTIKNYEIILVDDGSPDNCSQICDEYARSDNRIKVIHKTNGGLSSARNAGLAVAKGKYVGFVDSDDDVELDMYEKMVAVAERYNADFVMADYNRIEASGKDYVKPLGIDGGYYNRERIEKVIFPQLIMRETIDYGPLLSVVHCLYKRDFLELNKLTFDEEVRWSEDNFFSAVMGYYCNSFYYMKGDVLYHYYNNPDTITTSYRKGSWLVYCTMNKKLHAFFDDKTNYDFSSQLDYHLIYYASNCIGQEVNSPKGQAIHEINNILNSSQMIDLFKDFDMPKVSFKLKVQLYLMKWKRSRLLYFLINNR